MFGQELIEGELINFPTTEEELRIIAGETCILPKHINLDVGYIKDNKWVKVEETAKPIFNPEYEKLIKKQPCKINGIWFISYEITSLSEEEINEKLLVKKIERLKEIKIKISEVLNLKAVELDCLKNNNITFENSKEIAQFLVFKFLNSPIEKYAIEANSFEYWQNKVFEYCLAIEHSVIYNNEYIIDIEHILNNMPVYEMIRLDL